MKKVLSAIVGLLGLLMLSMGLRWLLAPAGVAESLGMPLLEGAALSTQVGDLSAFFLTVGVCIMLALITGKAHWYYPAIMLIGLAAFGRTLAWLLHGAALSTEAIGPEVIFTVILMLGARFLGGKQDQPA